MGTFLSIFFQIQYNFSIMYTQERSVDTYSRRCWRHEEKELGVGGI